MNERSQQPLRIQVTDAVLRVLKDRASLRRHSLGLYAEMVFQYVLHEPPELGKALEPRARAREEVYFGIEISTGTKHRLEHWSGRQRANLAVFCGVLMEAYLLKHERDPRDFAMIHQTGILLEQKTFLSPADLKSVVGLCDLAAGRGVGLPPGYAARWLFSRLKPLIRKIERNGQPMELTAQMIEEALSP